MVSTLLLCGDFAAHTGLSRVNEAIAAGLADRGWEIAVLAINYHGDAHPAQQRHRLYPAIGGGDSHGVGRIAAITEHVKPDVLLMVHDPWIISAWLSALHTGLPVEQDVPPAVAYIPVDGIGLNPAHVEPLNRLAAAITYTQFGRIQLRAAGLDAPCHVLPHGIDLDLFKPVDKAEARAHLGMDQDTFAVLVLDQNQPRKRLDIAFEAFAQFAMDKPETVKLIYHGPPVAHTGWDVVAMASDLGISERLLLSSRHITQTRGVKDDHMRIVYSACDVKLSTTSGEGWGLTTMEAMACGLPCIAPDFAALAEWARPAALLVPTPTRMRHCGEYDDAGINTVGRVPEVGAAAVALERIYTSASDRAYGRAKGLALVADPRYRWANIAGAFDHVLHSAMIDAVVGYVMPQEFADRSEVAA